VQPNRPQISDMNLQTGSRVPLMRVWASLACALPRYRRQLLVSTGSFLLVTSAASIMSMAASPVQAHAAGMPGPWPARHRSRSKADVLTLNARCESCHSEIAAEWRASYHAKAYTDSAFQRALAIEPLPFCKGCHAPEANPNVAEDPRLASLGVGCVSCHVVDGAVLATRANSRSAEHPVLRLAQFGGAAACANCHQFAFPGETMASGVAPMQGTIMEHAASDYAQVSCADCHMPKTAGGRASHRFDVTRNEALMRAAVSVEARRTDSQGVELSLRAKGVGHAFPTGDLFRRLEITAEALGPEQSKMAGEVAYLTRRFKTMRSAGGLLRRVSVGDDRLGVKDESRRTIQLDLGPDAAKWPIVWRLAYQRVEHPGMVGQPDAEVDGEIELARGVLAPGPSLHRVVAPGPQVQFPKSH